VRFVSRRDKLTRIEGFEWDETKRRKVLDERGIDFVDAAQLLLGEVLEYVSDRDGEPRFVAITKTADDAFLAIVYTIRGPNIRIITARPARKHEQRAYLLAVPNPPDEGAD
jgi:uncharacterized DUF497 family protein